MREDTTSAAEALKTLAGTRVDQRDESKRPRIRSFPAVSGPLAGFFSRVSERLRNISKIFDEVATAEQSLEKAEADFAAEPSSKSLQALLDKRQRVHDLREALPAEELIFADAEEAILLRPEAWQTLSAACHEKAKELQAIRDGILTDFLKALTAHVLETKNPFINLALMQGTDASIRVDQSLAAWESADSHSRGMTHAGNQAREIAEGRRKDDCTVAKFEELCQILASTTRSFQP
jgi:hypothetical protein